MTNKRQQLEYIRQNIMNNAGTCKHHVTSEWFNDFRHWVEMVCRAIQTDIPENLIEHGDALLVELCLGKAPDGTTTLQTREQFASFYNEFMS